MVFNHKMGADGTEKVMANKVEASNRFKLNGEQEEIDAWTLFTFNNRKGKYSTFTWDKSCFDGVDYDNRDHNSAIYQFANKGWDSAVDDENGNYDYLMGADLDFSNAKVREELTKYGQWVLDFTKVNGFRLDALKHIDRTFFYYWLNDLRTKNNQELFTVGEYWNQDINTLIDYVDINQHCLSLFDTPLHYHFHLASNSNGAQDLGALFEGTLAKERSECAVTFVENHDTQPTQALQSVVADWFKPSAYACILLRHEGVPCIFYGDYYGDSEHGLTCFKDVIDLQLKIRNQCMSGIRYDYFDNSNIVGWSYEGESANQGVVVVLSDKTAGEKKCYCGRHHIGTTYINVLDTNEKVVIDNNGDGLFPVNDGGLSIFIPENTYHKMK